MNTETKTVAAIGYSSKVAEPFVRGMIEQGLIVRLLTRDPDALAHRYSEANIVRGSLMEPDDVARVSDGVDAVIVQTPGAQRDDPTTESRAAPPILAGLKATNVKHLIYTSVLAGHGGTGVGRHEGKAEVERQIKASGVPYSILRCATFMEDFFGPRVKEIRAGYLRFPINRSSRFNYTSQRDFAPFVSQILLEDGPLNRSIDFVDPGVHDVNQIEQLLTRTLGREVKIAAKFPAYYLLMAAGPYYRWRNHRMAWVLPLLRYWDKHGNLSTGESVSSVAPSFQMTPLRQYLEELLGN